jgi:hypothetical protein
VSWLIYENATAAGALEGRLLAAYMPPLNRI